MHISKYKKASVRISKRNKIKKNLSLFLKIVPVFILFGGAVFLLRTDFLKVKNFNVVGTEAVSVESLKSVAQNLTAGNKFLLIPKSNILFLNKDQLANVLLSDFTKIEKVEVGKGFFNQSIDLKITERKEDFLWCDDTDKCFSMTKGGLVFASSDISVAKLDKIIFRGVLGGDPLMQNFATKEQMQKYLGLIENLKSANLGVSVIKIESSDRGVAETGIGKIIFNPEEKDLSLAIQNATLLIKETKIKNPSVNFQYIDTRFGNKMFYKTR